jgi:hypothetical protein
MFAPQLATDTTCVVSYGLLDVVNGSAVLTVWNAQNSNTAFDGFTVLCSSAISGTIRVYGYQNS